jgi:hypothetical protein
VGGESLRSGGLSNYPKKLNLLNATRKSLKCVTNRIYNSTKLGGHSFDFKFSDRPQTNRSSIDPTPHSPQGGVMNTLHRERSEASPLSLIEILEDRKLLSLTVVSGPIATPITPIILTPPIQPVAPVPTPSSIVSGRNIYAEVDQPFRAVVGSIAVLPPIAAGFTLEAMINWGDGTPSTLASFVHEANGPTDLIGSHTYGAAGIDDTTVSLILAPPAGSAASVILLGSASGTADVISSNGAVTLSKSAGIDFAANVGSFSSNLPVSLMTATIDWGDGTTSVGNILALPVATPVAGGRFEVIGSHTYAKTGSYAVNVTVTASPVVDPPAATPPIILVAQIESVADILPISPIAAFMSEEPLFGGLPGGAMFSLL